MKKIINKIFYWYDVFVIWKARREVKRGEVYTMEEVFGEDEKNEKTKA